MISEKLRLSVLAAALISLPLQAAAADKHSHDNHQQPHGQQHNTQVPIEYLLDRINQLEQTVVYLQDQVNAFGPIGQYVSLQTVNGQPTVRFSGVNVQVVNGLGSTATANALGNLIIGYDEADGSGLYHCTIGANGATNPPTPVTDQTGCTNVGGTWTNAGFKSGSHYLVLGTQNNYSRWGGLITGVSNTSNYDYTNVSGGNQNTASNLYSSVSGGWRNHARGDYSSISGGSQNTSSGHLSSISGGDQNVASGTNSSVVAGAGNTASGTHSSVSGGNNQTASGDLSSVSGGWHNTASGWASSVSGGQGNTASGGSPTDSSLGFSTVSGGRDNTASGNYSHVCGGNGKTASATDGVVCVNAPAP